MKKLAFLFVAFLMVACNGSEEGYTIKINLPDQGSDTFYISQLVGGEMVEIDSVTLDSAGMGELSGTFENPEMVMLGTADMRRGVPFFLANALYAVSAEEAGLKITAEEGPQKDYTAYQEEVKGFEERKQEVIANYNAARAAGAEQEELDEIVSGYNAIQDEQTKFDSSYMQQNPASLVSAFILNSMHYRMDASELETALGVLDASLHTSTYYTDLSEKLGRMKSVEIGQPFVDFALPDPDSNMLAISDIAGKGVLLIDFWAAWCGPCRRANPGVVEVYNQFKDQGFDIVGVSLDRNKEDWLQAIEDDNLTWHHMSDLKFWESEGAKLYAVSSIPHTVLLDQNGTIVARNLSKDELKAKIEELLAEV